MNGVGENELRSILDATPFPIALVNLSADKIEFWSRSALNLFGHTAPTASEWYLIAYPDPEYRKKVITQWNSALETARQSSQTVNTGEYSITCSDGSVRICELYATYLSDKLIVTFSDITERKKTENELLKKTAILEAQINSSIDGILIVDSKGHKIFQNHRCIDLWKIPEEIVANNDDAQQVEFVKNRTKYPDKFVEKVVYLYAHPTEISHDEVEFKDGMVLDSYSSPVTGKDGVDIGRIWMFRDITERKAAEEEIKRHAEEIERTNKLMVGRELKMIELKKEIEELKKKSLTL
jgi:PAS domain S-box-containing protein